MTQPNYAWWPWRTLAATVGLVSGLVTVFGLMEADRRSEAEVLGVTLTIFAGGNALILGSAIGDLGRTIVTLLISVGVAALFSFGPVEFGLLAPWAIVPAMTASLSMDRTFPGFWASALFGVQAVLIGTMAYAVVWLVVMWLWSLVLRGADPSILAVPAGCAVGNAFLVGYLFNAARRVQTELPRGCEEDQV